MLRQVVLSICLIYAAFFFIRSVRNSPHPEEVVGLKQRPQNEPTDLFVSSAYYLEPNETENVHIVRLIAMAPQSPALPPIFCSNQLDDRVEARVEMMGGAKMCRWWNLLIDCPFQSPVSRLRLGEKGTIEIPIRHPAKKNHNVVVCFARLFTFENWRVALTAIELYLHHGVDFFHLPIISVLRDLHTIFNHYEQLGIVRLADGVVMPSLINGEDPNRETEFFNQIVANTECLYEYRRSEFVIFADIDDVLIPRHFRSIHDELIGLSRWFPRAASFEFMRNGGTWIKFGRDPKEFNLTDTLEHISFVGLGVHVPGKTAVIPQRTRQGLMHRPNRERTELLKGFEHVQLDEKEANFLHLRGYVLDGNWTHPFDSYVTEIDYSGVQAAFSKRIGGNSKVKRAFRSLPLRNFYYEAMEACYLELGSRLHRGEQFCPNPLDCGPPPSSHLPPCIRQQNEFEKKRVNEQLTVHQRARISYFESNDCLL
ncbi:Glycosyltransferase family 92 protein [Aphelenchoides fujianensis]|nr:Glycosyltransferase family 92 protein [Aphelenchoides fujianensis]